MTPSRENLILDSLDTLKDYIERLKDNVKYNHLRDSEIEAILKCCEYRIEEILWSIDKV